MYVMLKATLHRIALANTSWILWNISTLCFLYLTTFYEALQIKFISNACINALTFYFEIHEFCIGKGTSCILMQFVVIVNYAIVQYYLIK